MYIGLLRVGWMVAILSGNIVYYLAQATISVCPARNYNQTGTRSRRWALAHAEQVKTMHGGAAAHNHAR